MDNYTRNWIGLFILGAINNLPYVIVVSAAKTIADSFDERNQVGLVVGANVALSVVVKFGNTFFLLKTRYWIRYVVNAVLMLIGLFGVAYAFSFWFALICIVFVGASAAFGENVALGYLRLFPSTLVNAWSSGTGMAGVLGAGIYIIFGCVVGAGGHNTAQLKSLTKYAFLLTTPFVALYMISYFFIIKPPLPEETSDQGSARSVGNVQAEEEEDEVHKPLLHDAVSGEEQVFEAPAERLRMYEETMCRRIIRCFKLTTWLSFNLCAVYLFEYIVQGCAAKVRPKSEYNIGCPELYAALSLCYQAGVFVSRSSVQLLRIQRIEILTILQAINMVIWLFDVHYKFMPTSILPVVMIYVGLLGGASYVNIFFRLLHDDVYPDKDRELCINIVAIFITLGIVLGTVSETILFNTVLKSD
ncbi:battenin-like [Mizuhopecten yessoensis]|uniref:Battenin n=1 Tax=Mizuhopecten yessoensis TaxID=6573 RepID=A0A210QPC3_MIZYE|nr:battenin-like [Mizuhopecten yessoensis]XP_021353384.1 battenin-like [Mizuhopecten yessoensis]XP_021353385.1 battenin-like [Mizuhopecten yessoensis]OWF50565.1 Battenin [Mizuhopecten yessoensis]